MNHRESFMSRAGDLVLLTPRAHSNLHLDDEHEEWMKHVEVMFAVANEIQKQRKSHGHELDHTLDFDPVEIIFA